ncbi:MAG: flagellar hook-basal body complex protein FliE [Burkholderiales bacterium]
MNEISAVRSAVALSTPAGASGGVTAAGGGFGQALARALESVNHAQAEANSLGRRFQLGDESVSLEETMIAMQKSSIGFQTVVQARNRLVSAYNDIMNMNV